MNVLRAVSVVPVAAGLAAGATLIADRGWPWWLLAVALLVVGTGGLLTAYCVERPSPARYLRYAAVVAVTFTVVGAIGWDKGDDGEGIPRVVMGLFFGGLSWAGALTGIPMLSAWRRWSGE